MVDFADLRGAVVHQLSQRSGLLILAVSQGLKLKPEKAALLLGRSCQRLYYQQHVWVVNLSESVNALWALLPIVSYYITAVASRGPTLYAFVLVL